MSYPPNLIHHYRRCLALSQGVPILDKFLIEANTSIPRHAMIMRSTLVDADLGVAGKRALLADVRGLTPG